MLKCKWKGAHMRHGRRSYKEVLKDKRGLSTSLIETLGGVSLKMFGLGIGGALMVTLLTFWVVSTSSADTSSGFQATGIAFEKAVKGSDVVIGSGDNRVGLLSDTDDGCRVETWQNGTRDGHTTLRVDTTTVPGVCTPTTALVEPDTGETGQELLFNIEAPVFTYSNLGMRGITFDGNAAPTLATETKPDGAKHSDWDDVRPYSVKLKLVSLNEDTSTAARTAELSGVTNVVNVTVAEDDLRYVPAPSTDPVPGPLRIASVARSTTEGDVVGGVREGISVTISGGVCPPTADGKPTPTTITTTYTRQSPSTAAPVTTITTRELTGATTALDLKSVPVPNGSSGAVEVAVKCPNGSVVEKAVTGYTQPVPTPVLTVKQNAAAEKHDLSWPKVSSLPVDYQIRWSSTNGQSGKTNLPGLSTTITQAQGSTYGYTSTYWLKAQVDSVVTPESSASIGNSWPAVGKPGLSVDGGNNNRAVWNWGAVSCPAGTNPEYVARYVREDTGEAGWSAATTSRSYAIDTQWQGYTYRADAMARCFSSVTGSRSAWSAVGNGPNFFRNVDRPTATNFVMRQTSDRNLNTVPYAYCSGGAELYMSVVEASWDMRWVGGPKNNQLGWWSDGWYESNWGIVQSNIYNPAGPFVRGNRFQVKVQVECWNRPMWRGSGANINVSQMHTWW